MDLAYDWDLRQYRDVSDYSRHAQIDWSTGARDVLQEVAHLQGFHPPPKGTGHNNGSKTLTPDPDQHVVEEYFVS